MAKLETIVNFDINSWPYTHSSMVPNDAPMFYGTDSEQLYNRNLKYAPQDWLYRNKKVNYTFNNYGLRMSDNITSEGKSIYFSGTSFTLGIGIDQNDRFSELVSNETKLNFINYSGPTYTIKLQVLSFFNYLKNHSKPDVLVIEYPPVSATTFFAKNKALFCYHNHMSSIDEYAKLYRVLENSNFFYEEATYLRQQLKSVCKSLGIKLIELTFKPKEQFIIDNDIFAYDLDKVDTSDINLRYARDLFKDSGHPGIQVHRDIADYILGRL